MPAGAFAPPRLCWSSDGHLPNRRSLCRQPMEALGPVLLLLSIPMMLRWVPPNRFYEFRISATLSNRSVWYDVNALSGRRLFALGAAMIALEFVLPVSTRIPVLRAVGVVGLAVIMISNWRSANRWRHDRDDARRRDDAADR